MHIQYSIHMEVSIMISGGTYFCENCTQVVTATWYF